MNNSEELKATFDAYKATQTFAPVAAAQGTDGVWEEIASLMALREETEERTAKLVSARPAAKYQRP